MAVYPCSVGNHRYTQAQRSLYVSEISGRDPTTRKLRLCPKHFAVLADVVVNTMSFIDPDDGSQMSWTCEADGCPEERGTTLFAKLYSESKEEPQQYAADLCDAHAARLKEALGWDGALPMQAAG